MHKITSIDIALYKVPLVKPLSDAKVLAGRQAPLAHVDMLTATIHTDDGSQGFGFSYSLRAGGAALYAHAKDVAAVLIGEDARDIGRLWEKMAWIGASVSRTGVTVQAIAAFDIALWDLKAKSAGVSIGKLLGAYREAVPCYNTSGGYLNAPIDEVIANVDASLARGIGGIKLKVGQKDLAKDLARVAAVREHIGPDVPLMVDANQQWDLTQALRAGRAMEKFNLTWIEEPLNAYDHAGHAQLTQRLDTPIGTGEMLSSVSEVQQLIDHQAITYLQADAPRIGGITPFLKIMAYSDLKRLKLAPHFVMEVHIHLACAYPHESWVEHIEWLEPAFNERLRIADGCMHLPTSPGLGFSLSPQADTWRVASDQL